MLEEVCLDAMYSVSSAESLFFFFYKDYSNNKRI